MSDSSKKASTASLILAVARIAIGVMFLFFAQYKLMQRDFAHGGYQKTVSGWVDATSIRPYRPFLRATLHYPVASGYAVGVAELLIGASMVLGFWVRPFSLVGALFMFNLILATWNLPPGSATWKYLGNQLDNIPLLFLFLIFFFHGAGETLGLDGK